MINLIYGAKGSGKTEKIIACANDRVRTSKGNVVYITDREGHSGDVDNAVRFIDIKRYGVDDGKSALSFIKGLLAGNYDITDVYIDGLAKFIKKPVTEIEEVLAELALVSDETEVNFTLTISTAELPDFMKKYI